MSTSNDTHICEGIVIKPVVERHDSRVGRVALKLINPEYLTGTAAEEEIRDA